MLEIANQLVQSLFKKNSLQECTRWELEILADKYPYFGIAQLLVSGKLKEENTAEYEKQVQKTSLYFTNPLWLDYILNKKPFLPGVKLPETSGQAHEAFTTVKDGIAAEIIESPATNDIPDRTAIEDSASENFGAIVTEKEEATPVASFTEVIEAPATGNAPLQTEIEEQSTTNIEDANSETKEDIPVTGPEIVSDNENKLEKISIAPLKQEALTGSNAPLTFEPYHTVDYFASQGIKLTQEEKPQDRFGQQLKSFTQWLKTIKKIPPAEIAKELGKGNEQKVVTLAEHSLSDREIVTETMAEVWLKQGNKAKAIEVYNKLSLQNPAKSAYFAGLIEQLKQH